MKPEILYGQLKNKKEIEILNNKLNLILSDLISSNTKLGERLKSKLFTDMFNILGFKIFSHIDYEPLEMGIKYDNIVDENVNETLCEFERETGGFIRVFPKKDNIEYYKPFFEGFICEENLKLWEIIEKNDDF